ncbi:hypothetical protein [Cognatilysobacter bugurensis]|uniref:Uncharacterized protein n=1 Tax=Cognatilysobacter bugurensis TaxID=543356 RepID=A0A918WA00_9GAMM|nr:hypothetical protein [Lysobacter bugurensis]GHA87359.1 hypothetical protein GCM10007067_26590 [Lysobacter bugurensis]
MPTLWFVPDGRVPYTSHGPGMPITLEEAVAVFGTDPLRYLGRAAPSLQPDAPSEDPRNVIVELGEAEGRNTLLPEPGFYWAVSLDVDDAARRLQRERMRR